MIDCSINSSAQRILEHVMQLRDSSGNGHLRFRTSSFLPASSSLLSYIAIFETHLKNLKLVLVSRCEWF